MGIIESLIHLPTAEQWPLIKPLILLMQVFFLPFMGLLIVSSIASVAFKVGEQGEAKGFLIGDETPTGTNRYAKLVGDDKVFLVSSYSKNNFEKEAWDLRDKNVLHFESGDVQKVTLTGPEGEVVLVKSGEDQWNVTTPSFCRADRYKASSLVTRFETAKMEEIVTESTDNLDEYGLIQSRSSPHMVPR